jgi:uncharacterized protein (TIGR00251 family)
LHLVTRDGGVTFEVRVVPNAPRCAVRQGADGQLKVRIDAPPVDGAANDRLVRFLARDVFGVPRHAVTLVRGEHGRIKTIAVALPEGEVRRLLTLALVPEIR